MKAVLKYWEPILWDKERDQERDSSTQAWMQSGAVQTKDTTAGFSRSLNPAFFMRCLFKGFGLGRPLNPEGPRVIASFSSVCPPWATALLDG